MTRIRRILQSITNYHGAVVQPSGSMVPFVVCCDYVLLPKSPIHHHHEKRHEELIRKGDWILYNGGGALVTRIRRILQSITNYHGALVQPSGSMVPFVVCCNYVLLPKSPMHHHHEKCH